MVRGWLHWAVVLWIGLAGAHPAAGEEGGAGAPALQFVRGPAMVPLGGVARLDLPDGLLFLDGAGARMMLRRLGNVPSGRELGLVLPTNAVWCALVEFSDIGMVQLVEGGLRADAMWEALRRANDRANREREKSGGLSMQLLGWAMEPQLDAAAGTVDWAVRATSTRSTVLNRSHRRLGRRGVLELTLMDQHSLVSTEEGFRGLLQRIRFVPGERWEDASTSDRQCGLDTLTALTLGASATTPGSSSHTPKNGRARVRTEVKQVSRVWLGGGAVLLLAIGLLLARRAWLRHRAKRWRQRVPMSCFAVARGASGNPPVSPRWRHRRFDFDKFYFDLIRRL